MSERSLEILLVEDNANDEELALRSLRKHHLANTIHVARDGAEALEFVFGTGRHASRGTDPSSLVILLDLKLPKVDGLEVLRRIKASPATRPLPVVVLTSSREARDIIESYKLGVNSYIVKPVDFEQFSDSMHQLGLYWLLLSQPPQSAHPCAQPAAADPTTADSPAAPPAGPPRADP